MKPFSNLYCNVTFVAEGCEDLPAYKGDGFIATFWKPTTEELVMLQAGMPIKLSFVGDSLPPVSLEVDTM